ADSIDLCRSIRARGGVDPILVKNMDELVATLKNVLVNDDLVLTAGAGDIGRMASELPARLKECAG
ncbi:MAG: UDP-N-acetylmuramate--L-alanine ligase, partial [Gammaproteobacteria bacterium]|nr:UDP-N-acetylmuramate--L-alanine ligase [Gammaproteobacteria bacterium]